MSAGRSHTRNAKQLGPSSAKTTPKRSVTTQNEESSFSDTISDKGIEAIPEKQDFSQPETVT